LKVLQYKGDDSLLTIPQDFILSSDCGKYHTKLLVKLAGLGPNGKDNAIGFAANQLRVNAHCFLALINNQWKFFANCEIIDRGDIYLAPEQCLSLPNKEYSVERYNVIVVEYLNSKGNQMIETYHDLEAQIIQHEVDHCNGILIKQFVDYYNVNKQNKGVAQ
tara:strand:+ start:232 stop:717 length:486 start_codon:yes stop_codon:yes gene_type:complete